MAEKKNIIVPPQSLESERAVLGCMLTDSSAIYKVQKIINQHSFYDKNNQIIYLNIIDLDKDGESVDQITIIEKLKKNKKLESIGGAYYITGLLNEAPSIENVSHYAKIVKSKEILRTIIVTARNMSKSAFEDSEDPEIILDKAEQEIFQLSQSTRKGSFLPINSLLHNVLETWSSREPGQLSGVPLGYTGLDKYLNGFQNSDLIIVAGRPAMGKTSLALSIARNAALDFKKKVAVFSLEMSSEQLVQRLIASEARVNGYAIRTGKLPKNDFKKLSEAAGLLSESNIYIDDTPGLTIIDLRAKARELKASKDVDIIFVDYIQLLSGGYRFESRQQEISMISRSLKALAKELNIPIVAVSQLSRAVENRTDHRPILSDLRESGAIEQDADVIMFIYRKHYYTQAEEDEGVSDIIIAKHRNGPSGTVKLAFIDKYTRFENLEQYHDDFQDIDIPA